MRFSTNALAILASSSSSSSSKGSRTLKQQQHRQLQQHQHQLQHHQHRVVASASSSRQEERHAERLIKKSSPGNDSGNGKQPRVITSTVVSKLKSLRETVECDPLLADDDVPFLQEERRLRGHHQDDEDEEEEEETVASKNNSQDNFVGILSRNEKNNKQSFAAAAAAAVSSKVCGVGRRCQKVVEESDSSSTLGGRCVDSNDKDSTSTHTHTHTEHTRRERELQDELVEPVVTVTVVDSNSNLNTGTTPTSMPTSFEPTSMPTTFEPTTFIPTSGGGGGTTIYYYDFGNITVTDAEAAELNNGNGNETNANYSIVDELQYACDYGDLVGYDCTCDFDLNTYTGSATCNTPEKCYTSSSICNVNVTECYTSTYDIELVNGIKGVWESMLCLKFNTPYEQEVCYGSTILEYGKSLDEQCILSLDSNICTSCNVYKFRNENCYEFDCSNTGTQSDTDTDNPPPQRGSKTGNTCDFPAHSISLFLDTYGCPSCDLCGVGNELTLPLNTIELFNTTYECSYVEEVSLQGFFTEDSCSYFTELAQIPCGCTPIDGFIAAVDVVDEVDVESTTTIGIDENNDTSTTIVFDAACSAHSGCSTLEGDCCPTTTGDNLGCCDIPIDEEEEELELDDGSNITTTTVVPTTAPIVAADLLPEVVEIDDDGNFTDSPSSLGTTWSPTTVTPPDDDSICNICPDGIVNPDGVISMMPGSSTVSEISCSEATSVASNGGIVSDELCEAVQKEASLPCCGIELVLVDEVVEEETPVTITTPEEEEDTSNFCAPCGKNKIMTLEQNEVSVPTQGLFTCLQLQQLGLDGTLDNNGICALVQSSSQKACGCIADGSPTIAPSMSSPSSNAATFPTSATTGDGNAAAASGAVATSTAGISMSVIVVTVAVTTISMIASLSFS